MTDKQKWTAVLANDKRFDGQFFYGVKSTGIYCRRSCASRPPKAENVVFFDSREEAEHAGYRPCKRCRPDLPAYHPQEDLAAAAKACIDHSFAERSALQEQIRTLGVTRRHLTELFEKAYGLSPEQYAAQVRLEHAMAMLRQGQKATDVAFAVGLESASAFTGFFKKQTGLTPSEYASKMASEHPFCTCKTPLGAVHIEAGPQGITTLRFEEAAAPLPAPLGESPLLSAACRQLLEYFEGRRRAFDLPLSPQGSAFQQSVWHALRGIPYGETRSYQQIAEAVGSPKAARAVGMANNRNPILILIPCHRVVGKDGRLVGYAGGIERKQILLKLEAEP